MSLVHCVLFVRTEPRGLQYTFFLFCCVPNLPGESVLMFDVGHFAMRSAQGGPNIMYQRWTGHTFNRRTKWTSTLNRHHAATRQYGVIIAKLCVCSCPLSGNVAFWFHFSQSMRERKHGFDLTWNFTRVARNAIKPGDASTSIDCKGQAMLMASVRLNVAIHAEHLE